MDLDNTDLSEWTRDPVTIQFRNKILSQRDMAFKALIKQGEKKHSENAERYKAFDWVAKVIEEYSGLQ